MAEAKNSQSLSVNVVASVFVVIIYVLLYATVAYVINPVQDLLYPHLSGILSLVFLPHGVRVLATMAMGLRAVPALVIASLICNYFLFGITDPTASVLFAIVSGFGPWVTLSCLKLLGVDAFYLENSRTLPPFRILVLGGILCSVTNGLLTSAIFEAFYGVHPVALVQLGYIIGDVTGLLLTWLAAQQLLRLWTKLAK